MTQLLKHYLINRDTGEYALTIPSGYMNVNIEGLEIIHRLFTKEEIPYCLSTCPDVLEYSTTLSSEELITYQNNPEITIVSSLEREVEIPLQNGQTNTQIVYDVIYTKPHIIPQTTGEGMKVITQEDWDIEIALFDDRQQEKRYDILRKYRDKLLALTDWIVIKSQEQNEELSLEFKTWRQQLRNLPNGETFPSGFPTLPAELENDNNIQEIYSKFYEVSSIFMINDPLSA